MTSTLDDTAIFTPPLAPPKRYSSGETSTGTNSSTGTSTGTSSSGTSGYNMKANCMTTWRGARLESIDENGRLTASFYI